MITKEYNSVVIFDRAKIRIKSGNSWFVYSYDEIVDICSDLNYSIVSSSDKKNYFVDCPIKIFAKNLPLIFFKYSRSGITNLGYMFSYFIKNRKLQINMKDGTSHNVSRGLTKSLYEKLKLIDDISLPCETCKSCAKRDSCAGFVPFMI